MVGKGGDGGGLKGKDRAGKRFGREQRGEKEGGWKDDGGTREGKRCGGRGQFVCDLLLCSVVLRLTAINASAQACTASTKKKASSVQSNAAHREA